MESNPQAFEFEPTVDGPKESRSPLDFAWRRKWLVLAALLIGLVLGYTYFVKTPPVYESRAQVLVIEHQVKLPVDNIEISISSSEDMHRRLMKSEAVIENALQLGELRQLPSLSGSADPERLVMGGIDVKAEGESWQTGTVLLLVSYQGTHREDCSQILAAVVEAYELFLSEMSQDVSREAIDLIQQAKDELGTKLEVITEEYKVWREHSPITLADAYGANIHEVEVQRLQERLSSLNFENIRLQAQLDSLVEDPIAGQRDMLNLIIAQIDSRAFSSTRSLRVGDNSIDGLERAPKELIPFKVDELALLDKYGPHHPQVVAMRERIRLVEELLTPNEKTRDNYFELHLESLRKTIQINEQEIAQISDWHGRELAAAKAMGKIEVTDETYNAEIDRMSRFFYAVVGRLEEIDLFKGQRGSDVKIVNRPSSAGQVAPDLIRVMLVSTVLSLCAALGLAFVINEADRRFLSPNEVRDDFGVSVVGHIPRFSESESDNSSSELATLTNPNGAVAEAYRAVRTAIYFNARGGGERVIQITSPTPADGKTTLAANLAISVAQSGKSVLLIDGDFRRPRCHRLFDVPNELGAASILEGKAEWVDAVQSVDIENLSLLTCGERPKYPSELLASQQFGELLDFVREKFDLVIVDSPPVLVVSDALNIAARADAVLVVIKLTKTVRHAGRQALDALEEVGTKVLGVVVNGVGGDQSFAANNYSQYRYRYGQPYGYDNGYRYKESGGGYGSTDDELEPENADRNKRPQKQRT